MNNKSRIYGENIKISKLDVKEFWNNRADKYSDENPYNTVKLNDNNSEYVKMLDEYERSNIMPKLNINEKSRVLDIGCGVGRLAESIVDVSSYYIGIDISEKLIDIAKNRIKSDKNYDFVVSDFKDIDKISLAKDNGPFNIVILAGLAMYINDVELVDCFKSIVNLIDDNCLIYISGPVAINKRLTLSNFYSEQLKSEYSVIYRTEKEYIELFTTLIDNGFKVKESKSFLLDEKQYSETQRHYFILSK